MTEIKPSIADIVDQIGLGATHLRYVFSGGGVWLADGLELSLISSIAAAVGSTFDVGPTARGMLVSIVYIGVFFGNLFSGPFGDRYGRRNCIMGSYILIFIFSMLSSFAPTYASLVVIRFMVGVSFGFGQPVWNTMATEIAPSAWRTLINAGSQALFTVGEVYCYFLVYLEDPWMKKLSWRLLLQEGAIPSLVFFFVALAWLLDSPYFLARKGRKSEAQEVLKTMQRDNCRPDLPLDFHDDVPREADEEEGAAQFRAVFSAELISTTLITIHSCFVMNFVYYGALYAFPNVLPYLGSASRTLTPAMDCIVGALWEFPGYALAVMFAMFYARKPVMKLYCLLCGASMILFAVGVHVGNSALWHVGLYGVKCSGCIGYVVVYVYIGEVYPTKVRVTGGAVSLAGGRFGAMLAPLAYELLTAWTGTFVPFFVGTAILCLTNIPLIGLLPFETFNASLSASDTLKAKSYGATDTPSLDPERPPEAGS